MISRIANLFTAESRIHSGPVLIGSLVFCFAGSELVNAQALEEVFVSAKRKDVSLMEIPIAVTAFSAEAIEFRNIQNSEDLVASVPNLTVGYDSGSPKIFLRGIGSDVSTLAGDPGVATYVNNVYVGRSDSSLATQVDLERIEVLRGPQGTLWGRNATAGAINYYTRRPTEETQIKVGGQLGNYDHQKAWMVGNIAASENFAGRLTAVTQKSDGYVTSLAGGDDLKDSDSWALRGSVSYKASDTLSVFASFDKQQDKMGFPAGMKLSDPQIVIPALGGVAGVDYIVSDDDYIAATELNPKTENMTEGGLVEVVWDIGDFSLKSLSAVRSFKRKQTSEGESTLLAAVIGDFPQKANQYSQEFNFSGEIGGIDAVFGLFGYYEEAEQSINVDLLVSILGNPPLNLLYNVKQDTTSYAAFADLNAPITDKVRAFGGLRYTLDEKDSKQKFATLVTLAPGVVIPVDGCTRLPGDAEPVVTSENWDEVTWSAGLEADLSDNAVVYGKASRGYKAGGFTDLGVCGDSYDPENAITYEIGLKGMFFDSRLNLTLAGFYTEYDDLQVQRTVFGGLTIENAGSAEVRGIELESTMVVTDGLTVDANFAWLDAEYNEFNTIYALDPFARELDLKGQQLARSPEYSGGIGVQYATMIPSTSFEMTARVEGYFTSSYNFSPAADYFSDIDPVFGNDDAKQEGYGIGNAYLKFVDSEFYNLTITGFVKNFTDEFYLTGALPVQTSFSVDGYAAAPRTWGVSVEATF